MKETDDIAIDIESLRLVKASDGRIVTHSRAETAKEKSINRLRSSPLQAKSGCFMQQFGWYRGENRP